MKKTLAAAIVFIALGLAVGWWLFGGPDPLADKPSPVREQIRRLVDENEKAPAPSVTPSASPTVHPPPPAPVVPPADPVAPVAVPVSPPVAAVPAEPAGGAVLLIAEELPTQLVSTPEIDISIADWLDHDSRREAMRSVVAAVPAALSPASTITLEAAATLVRDPEAGAAVQRLSKDEVLRQFLEERVAGYKAARAEAANEPKPTAVEMAETEAMIRRNFGEDVLLRDLLLLSEMDELALRYEEVGQFVSALSLHAARRDRLWDHPKQHFLCVRDMQRVAIASGRLALAYDLAVEYAVRRAGRPDWVWPEDSLFYNLTWFWADSDPAARERREQIAQPAAWLASLMQRPNDRAGPTPFWRKALVWLDRDLDGVLVASWPQTPEEEDAWLEELSEAWKRVPAPPPASEAMRAFADGEREKLDAARPDAPLAAARMLAVTGREREAVRELARAAALDDEATEFLARLVIMNRGDPRAIDPATPQFSMLDWPEEDKQAAARHLSRDGFGARRARSLRAELFADALRAVINNFDGIAREVKPGEHARLSSVLTRLIGHPALDRILINARNTGDWTEALLARVEARHREWLRERYAGRAALWETLRERMRRREFRAALAAVERIEADGPRWFEAEWIGDRRRACERGVLFSDFSDALLRDPDGVEPALARIRTAHPNVGLRAVFREAGCLPRRERDLALVEQAFGFDRKQMEEAVFAALQEAATVPKMPGMEDFVSHALRDAAEWELMRMALWIDLGRTAEAEADLERLADVCQAARLTAEYDALSEQFQREQAWDRWWPVKLDAQPGPGNWGELHQAVWGGENPALPEAEVLPLVCRRASALAVNGQRDESRALWALAFRLSPEGAARQQATEALGTFVALAEMEREGEFRAGLLALALDGESDAAMRERLFDRLCATFAGDTPEATLAAVRAWSEKLPDPSARRGVAMQIADQWYRQERYAEAVALLTAPELETDGGLLLRALCRLKLEDSARAEADLESLSERFPQSPLLDRALFTLGWAKATGGDPAAARGWFQRVIDEFPASPYARQARSFLQRLGGTVDGDTF